MTGMMDKVGILIVSKCLSSSAMVDTFLRSERYAPEFYVVERQRNPFNLERAKVHSVFPDLGVENIVKFAKRHKERIAFGLTDTEDFVIAGGRDRLEKEASVQMLCVTRKYALERSKADQRVLFDEICPTVNPRYKVFDPKEYPTEAAALEDFKKISVDLGEVVIKPDAPARGAGVGVWGSDFREESEMIAFFRSVYSKGRVVVEERVEGEESSFHAFSDGRHFVAAPLTRDYKRALDGNKGRLTGGMGSYRDSTHVLPFLTNSEWERVVKMERDAFEKWKGRGSNPELRGIVLYDALMHTGNGVKILERNSRGGNTEQINLLTTMKDDLVDVCYRMLDGTLRDIGFRRQACVVTCAVPQEYGRGGSSEKEREISLRRGYSLVEKHCGNIRFFPMDVTVRGRKTYLGKSRSVAVAGIGESLEEARRVSLLGARVLDGPVRYRADIASSSDLRRSSERMILLRAASGRVPSGP
jgi:phosphoribosylamine--glycine ligase